MARLDVTICIINSQGSECTEMKVCTKCGSQSGVFVFTQNTADCIGFSLSGERFDRVIWDRWQCLSCNHQWVERYGVRDGS